MDIYAETKSFQKITKSIAFWFAIAVLFSPIYFPILLAIYKTEIQLPRSHSQLVHDKQLVLEALNRFIDDTGHYPSELGFLVPKYLEALPHTFDNFSYYYNSSGDQLFGLTIYVPNDWLGWPAQYSCKNDNLKSPICGYIYICGSGKTGYFLPTADTPKDRDLLDYLGHENPCRS